MIEQRHPLNLRNVGETNIESYSCIACQGNLSFLGAKLSYAYRVCDNCKTVQISPLPRQSEIENAYSESQYATDAHGQMNPDEIRKSSHPYYVSLANTLKDYKAFGLIIDYGTGWGGLCELLVKAGFQCKGLELAKNMVAECQRRGLPVDQSTLEALVNKGTKARAIVLCGVFEHLPDPTTFLRNAHDILEDDGLLVSLQPAGSFALLLASIWRMGNVKKPLPSMFWLFDPPWHVALYSLMGMKLITEKNGFHLAEIRFAPQGRRRGFYGIAQVLLEYVNRVGWLLSGKAWPLMISHIFVFKKKSDYK